MAVRVTISTERPDPERVAPTWQTRLDGPAESVAEQGELFPDDRSAVRPGPLQADAPGQGRLFA